LRYTATVKAWLIAATLASMAAAHSAQYQVQPDWNVPRTVWDRFKAEKVLDSYEISAKLNPFYLRGDFDGDGVPDYAVLVVSRGTGISGIAMVRSHSKHIEILGAGGIKLRKAATPDGSGPALIDNFDWVDAWHVVTKSPLKTTGWDIPVTQMVGEGIEVEKAEASSALIYWDGKQYRWLQDSG
jgi:hypothetical protein